MRIGIDYTAAVRQGAGIGRYTRNLIRALSKLDDRNSYVLFVAGGWGQGDGLGGWPPNFRLRSVPVSDRWMNILWQRLRLPLPIQWIVGRLDLFHSPDFVLPPLGRTPAILTVHDLSFLQVPEHFVPSFRAYLEQAVPRAVRRAALILADSKSTKHDLGELLHVSQERIEVLYPGVEPRFQPIQEEETLEQVRTRHNLPEHFILGLSTLQPRKNFDGLVRAFKRLLTKHSDRFESLHLVIAGGVGWMSKGAVELVERLGLASRVHFTGFVNDEDLPALYTLASVFAFPSWYEGFGLPVLEAMACGTPVVAADNSSLPEVVGQAGLLVKAADCDALAQSLHRLLTDQELRARLIVAGQQQACQFAWESAARQLLELYHSFEKEQRGEKSRAERD
jgi:glycosyltransferase involved in cell wall biosynthesis